MSIDKKIKEFLSFYLKKNLPDIRPGDTVRVHQKIRETYKGKKGKIEERERVQVFEGVVIARKHGKEPGATITVRRIISGVGVERIFPLHSPTIKKIEVVSRAKVRRAKLYYLRKLVGKKAKLKRKKEFESLVYEEKAEEKEEKAGEGRIEKKAEEKENSGEVKEEKAGGVSDAAQEAKQHEKGAEEDSVKENKEETEEGQEEKSKEEKNSVSEKEEKASN